MQPLPIPGVRSLIEHVYTWALVVAAGAVYALYSVKQDLSQLEFLLFPLHFREVFTQGELWRLWSPILVHYTPAHLLTNLYLWWLLASKIEARQRRHLLLMCLCCGAISNGVQWWLMGPNFGGLSGLVYSAFGYCLVMDKLCRDAHFSLPNHLIMIMLALVPLAATGWFGKFADAAHISGLFSGALFAMCQVKFQLSSPLKQ